MDLDGCGTKIKDVCPPELLVLLLYQFGSIVTFTQVERAIQELSVAKRPCLLRARRAHHGLVS